MKTRDYFRDRAHRDIVFEALSINSINHDALYLNNPLDLGVITFWESNENIIIAGVDCKNGRLFDIYNRIVRYQDIPTLLILRLRRILVKQKQYEHK